MFVGGLFVDPETGSPNCSSKSSWIIRKQKPSRPKQEIPPSFYCSGSTPLPSWSAVMLSVSLFPQSFPRYRNWESQFLQGVVHRTIETGHHHQGCREWGQPWGRTNFILLLACHLLRLKKKMGECCKETVVSWETHFMVGSTEQKRITG